MKQDSTRHALGSWRQALLAVGLVVGLIFGGPAGMGQAHGLSARAALTRLMTAAGLAATSTSGRTSRALLVETWHGHTGPFRSIQAAVTAARPGDWILVAPGDYHESPTASVGVRIATPDLHLVGLNRNTVVVDGDRPGAPSACDPARRWQNLGPGAHGRDGIVVTASGVLVENRTVCNFLGHDRGRQVVFSGGPGGRPATVGAFTARYLTTTSRVLAPQVHGLAAYGIYVSNVTGPGMVSNNLASNMANSALHIGACRDCNTVFTQDTAVNSVIGLTAIDAGGRLRIEHSVVRGNASGIDLSSEEDESSPPPQDGACPAGQRGPEALSPRSCTVVRANLVDGNDTPNVPGGAGGGIQRFLGAGILIEGGRHDTVAANRVQNQGAYGIVLTMLPWQGTPGSPAGHCQGGLAVALYQLCMFNAFGNVVTENHLSHNGSFGNPTNGDLAEATLAKRPGTCFTGNLAVPGRSGTTVTKSPVGLQRPASTCGAPSGGTFFGPLGTQIACATGAFEPCAGTPANIIGVLEALAQTLHVDDAALRAPGVATSRAVYPSYARAAAPRPPIQPTLARPCRGAAVNAWC